MRDVSMFPLVSRYEKVAHSIERHSRVARFAVSQVRLKTYCPGKPKVLYAQHEM